MTKNIRKIYSILTIKSNKMSYSSNDAVIETKSCTYTQEKVYYRFFGSLNPNPVSKVPVSQERTLKSAKTTPF